MAAEGQEIPEEIKEQQIPAQEEGGDDEVGVTDNSALCWISCRILHTCVSLLL